MSPSPFRLHCRLSLLYILYMYVQYDCYLLSSLLWSSLCGCFLVACLLRSHVLSNLYHFKRSQTCQDLSLFGLAIRWTMCESDQGQPKPSKTTNQTETVRFLRHQHIHHDPQPNPVFAIEKGERRWKTDHGRPARLYIYMHHRYVQMRILRGYELLKMKDGDVLNMFEYAWTMVWEKPDKPHKTCCLSDCHIRIVSLCQLCMVPVRRCKWRDDIWHILISLITMIQISIMILPSKV